MKTHLVILLCACSAACAESPPVINNTGGVPNAAVAPSALTNDYELMKRLEQMQAEVQQLTGKVEEQAFYIEELKKQQKNMYTDFDDRIQNLETKSGGSQAAGDLPVSPSGAVAPESSSGSSSLQSSNEPPASEPPQPKSSSSPAPAAAAVPPSSEPVPPPAPEAMPLSASEKQEYQSAYDNLRNGRTAQAITQFNAFITNHPSSTYAGNAQYWLGEAHRVNMDNASARQAFNTVVEKYPRSAKVSDALLKLGYIEMEEKNTEKARETLTRVTTEYANTRAAALAQKKLATLR